MRSGLSEFHVKFVFFKEKLRNYEKVLSSKKAEVLTQNSEPQKSSMVSGVDETQVLL